MRKSFLYSFAVGLGVLGASAALAWTGPTASPPAGNVSAPLNISASAQSKGGNLGVGMTAAAALPLYVGDADTGLDLPDPNTLAIVTAGT